MKKIILLLAVLLSFSCGKDDGLVVTKQSSSSSTTTTTTVTPVSPTSKPKTKVKLSIALSGRSSYSNIYISLRKQKNGKIYEFIKPVDVNGNLTLDVSDYTDKTVYLSVHHKENEIYNIIKEADQTVSIGKQDDNLVIQLPKEKVYDVTITVLKGEKPAAGIAVYAINKWLWKSTDELLASMGTSILSAFPTAKTDAQGHALFKDLSISISNEYIFVAIYKDVVATLGDKCIYESAALVLNGEKQQAEIKQQLGKLKLYLDTNYPESIQFTLKTLMAKDINKKVSTSNEVLFDAIEPGEYILTAVKGEGCVTPEESVYVIKIDGTETKKQTISFKKNLVLNCTSSNPYTATVTDSNGNKISYRVGGKQKMMINVPFGKVKIEIKQISGYLFFPTKESYSRSVRCGDILSVSFPS
ncbi:hypothetical protein K4L44_08830 [Halosquirtibacter laminarini]|uniref:Uncharacterized protein n=1 Tax=Halosquirtibacter laminarini TaxID=3374600 RepID=A0AC61NPV3_9BACT|nr:hypothetical protein K4L44_08830 [Prolixibacteraceae bacterium]